MTFKVFIDGRHGTTGLKIDERLAQRTDVEILTIPEDKRKDAAVKAEHINAADIVFLCLPDAASKESVSLLAPGQQPHALSGCQHRAPHESGLGLWSARAARPA